MRFTSGTGAEVQMGYAEGKIHVIFEVRCIMIAKGQGFKDFKMVQLAVLEFQEP